MKKLGKVLKTISILLISLIVLSLIFLNFTVLYLKQSIIISSYIVFEAWFVIFQIKRMIKRR